MDRCGNYLLEDGRKLGRGGFGEVFQVGVHNLTHTNVTAYARKYFAPCPEYDDTAIKELTDLRQRFLGNDSNLLIVFYVQIMPDDLVMQLHRF
ncbi:Uncharacterised protein [Klebsiella pneumoniae]|nr:Uncharacterised protein [Klebsiella pneumoniae]STS47964.1 Uncharacterised protein [Klebsiella pneumoniae]